MTIPGQAYKTIPLVWVVIFTAEANCAQLSIACTFLSPVEVIVYPGRPPLHLQVVFTQVCFLPSIITNFLPHEFDRIRFFYGGLSIFIGRVFVYLQWGFSLFRFQLVYLWAYFFYFYRLFFSPNLCVAMSAPVTFVWEVRARYKWAFHRLHRPIHCCFVLNLRLCSHVLNDGVFPWDVGRLCSRWGFSGFLAVGSF